MKTYVLDTKESALLSVSEEDLWRASEEIVKAAAYYGRLRGRSVLSSCDHQALVQAVFTDPAITGMLFSDGTSARH